MSVKVGDTVLIEAVVQSVDMWNEAPVAFVVFKNSGGCTVYQTDLEVIETEIEEDYPNE